MTVIKLQLPSYAADLICRKTPQEAFDGMMGNNGLPFREMVAFGMVITPIINDETGAEWAHVVYWENGQVSVTRFIPGDEFMPLVGIEEWHGETYPDYDEALKIFYRFEAEFLEETNEDPKKDSKRT